MVFRSSAWRRRSRPRTTATWPGSLPSWAPSSRRSGRRRERYVSDPLVRFENATLDYHGRQVWQDLSLAFEPGSFVAILGPNGSGKTSLLRVILGLTTLASGRVEVLGGAPRRGNPGIGYVPQHSTFDRDLPLRGRDLVSLGLDGHRWGVGRPSAETRGRVAAAIASVDAGAYADAAIGRLS